MPQGMEWVLLLHGLGRDTAIMDKMARFMTAKNYSVLNIGYPSTKLPIHELAEYVAQKLEDKLSGKDVLRLHIVGHSLGAIIARVLLTSKEWRYETGRVVMLGPPNQGSKLVGHLRKYVLYRKLYGPAGSELEDFGKKLPVLDAISCGVIAGNSTTCVDRMFVFWLGWSGHDGKIMIEETKLKGSSHLVLPVDHPSMPNNRGVIDQTYAFLQRGSFVA